MNADAREEWLEERRRHLGGSDIQHALGLPPWGCPRKLSYEKQGQTPDYAPSNSLVLRRGQELEDLIARRYAEETGRKLVRRGLVVHPVHTWAAVSVDREIVGEARGVGSGVGVLEMKTAGPHAFRKMRREGLPEGYSLQLQWAMFVLGRKWGAFAVLDVEQWELTHFDVEYDANLVDAILPTLEQVWKAIEFGPRPDPFDPKDPRCGRCEFRRTCHGGEMLATIPQDDRDVVLEQDDSLREMLTDLREAEEYAVSASSTVEVIKTRLKDQLGERQAVAVEGYRVYYRERRGAARIDKAALEKAHPDIAKAFTKFDRPSRPLRIYAV